MHRRSVFSVWSRCTASVQEKRHLTGKTTRNMCLLIELKHKYFRLLQIRTDHIRLFELKMKSKHPLTLLRWCTRSWEHATKDRLVWRSLGSHAIEKKIFTIRQTRLSRNLSYWRLVIQTCRKFLQQIENCPDLCCQVIASTSTRSRLPNL